MQMIDFKEKLSGRIGKENIRELCSWAHEDTNKRRLYELTMSTDERVAYNALWVFCHFALCDNEWLYAKHDELIDRAMRETHDGRRRLLLTLLVRQPFTKETVRTDFIDFCIGRMMMPNEPYGTRVPCMKLAYEQCRHYPELAEELKRCLLVMDEQETLPASVKAARRNILKNL